MALGSATPVNAVLVPFIRLAIKEDCLIAVGVTVELVAKLPLKGPKKLLVALTEVAANLTIASSPVSFIAKLE